MALPVQNQVLILTILLYFHPIPSSSICSIAPMLMRILDTCCNLTPPYPNLCNSDKYVCKFVTLFSVRPLPVSNVWVFTMKL